MFLDLFGMPEEATCLEHLIVTDYEKAIILMMQKEVFEVTALESLVKTVLAEYKIQIPPLDIINRMYRRGNLNKRDDNVHFEISSLYTRLAYFAQYEQDTWSNVSESIRNAIDEWYVNQYANGAIPRLKQVQNGEIDLIENAYFFTLEEALDLIDTIDKQIYVVPCNCRSVHLGCDKIKNTCMLFEYGINSEFDRGYGKVITKTEAKDLAILANKNGLMHTSEEEHALCNCCGDCCYPIRAAKKIGATGIWPKRRHDIVYDNESCISCKKCIKVCNFNAFSYIDHQIVFDESKCLGCTLCAGHCPTDAIQLKEHSTL